MKTVSLALTRPLATSTETTPSRSVRIPFLVPVRAYRSRVVIRNANYRTNTPYPGAVTLTAVALGEQAVAGVPSFGDEPELLCSDTRVEDLGAGWVSDWIDTPLVPGVGYLLEYGYRTDGQPVHLGMGSGWQSSSPRSAALAAGGQFAKAIRQPFDVRIEYQVRSDTPLDVVIGDSISAASNASFPVLEAPLALANREAGRATHLGSFGGARFDEWIGPNWGDPESMKWRDLTEYGRADRAFIALGSNDIHAGMNYSTLLARARSMIMLVHERISTDVTVCTVTPRTAWMGTPKEAIRVAFNAWLCTLPEGVTGVADTARAVEDKTGHAPCAALVVRDGIHFNTAGSVRLAEAIPRG